MSAHTRSDLIRSSATGSLYRLTEARLVAVYPERAERCSITVSGRDLIDTFAWQSPVSPSDATLIASASDLYLALRGLRQSCADLIDSGDCGKQPLSIELLAAADAAIAKAEGK